MNRGKVHTGWTKLSAWWIVEPQTTAPTEWTWTVGLFISKVHFTTWRMR